MKTKNIDTGLLPNLDDMVPGNSIDCIIIGFEDQQLKILILKWKFVEDLWAVPGGFIQVDEDLDKAAVRVLRERTGIELPFLEQFKTFGNCGRRDPDILQQIIDSRNSNPKIIEWFQNRFISTGYVSLVDIQKCQLKLDLISEEMKWAPLNNLPPLIFDHHEIVVSGVNYIRNQMNYLPVGISLLPEKFTMKDLQGLYEAILNRKLDRGNFQRKMLKLGIFIRHEKELKGGSHKAPYLYSFDKEKYNKLLVNGFGFNS